MNWNKGIKIHSNILNENSTLAQILSLVTTSKASQYSDLGGGGYFSYSPEVFLV